MYGYAAPFYSNPIYYILLVPVLILSVYAQIKVSSTFKRYSKIPDRRGVTGAQAAYEVLRAHGIHDVQIRPCGGSLTDHYDPRDRVVRLSESVYGSPSIAAIGVAAHEVGHAVQHATGYSPMKLRSAIVSVTNIGSTLSMPLILIGLVMNSSGLAMAGVALFSLVAAFQLVTLPVEFNASHRALATLESRDILSPQELSGAKSVLTAAALTYVAALIQSLAQLLRFVLIFLGRSDNGRRGGGR